MRKNEISKKNISQEMTTIRKKEKRNAESRETSIMTSNLAITEAVQDGNRLYTIRQTDDESREMYLQRVNFIIKTMNTSPTNKLSNVVALSYIWRNITFFGMSYPQSVLRRLNRINN